MDINGITIAGVVIASMTVSSLLSRRIQKTQKEDLMSIDRETIKRYEKVLREKENEL